MPASALVHTVLHKDAYPAATRAADWRLHAACAGLPDETVFAHRPKPALPALRACAICPVRRRCLETVAPAESWFDGVSGGRLWRNGKEVRIPTDLTPEPDLAVDYPDHP